MQTASYDSADHIIGLPYDAPGPAPYGARAGNQTADGTGAGTLPGQPLHRSRAGGIAEIRRGLLAGLPVSRREAREGIGRYFHFYNHQRLHQSLGYPSADGLTDGAERGKGGTQTPAPFPQTPIPAGGNDDQTQPGFADINLSPTKIGLDFGVHLPYFTEGCMHRGL